MIEFSSMVLRFLTAGESHGPELNIIVEGIPANMTLLEEDINLDLKRRQGGYGRGGRMKIETDKVIFTSGVRHGRTFGGAPVGMKLINKDHQKWLNVMSASPVEDPKLKEELDEKYISKVRPGHADFAGALKYDAPDVRDILERSSARETTSRVATGALCKAFLKQFNIEIFSHVLRIGELEVSEEAKTWWHDLVQGSGLRAQKDEYLKRKALIEESELRTYKQDDKKFKDYIDTIRKKGDTVGGLLEVFVLGAPVGLGSHVQWDRRIDGLIAQAMMSTHTVKSVEVGIGQAVAENLGSEVHDQLYIDQKYRFDSGASKARLTSPEQAELTDASMMTVKDECNAAIGATGLNLRYTRKTNNLGGIEGGMTNGMPITCKVGVKPIPTLISKLDSIDLDTKEAAKSHFERSDICVVPAAGVVLEAMMAIVIAQSMLEKFGGDSIEETKRNYTGYLEQIAKR